MAAILPVSGSSTSPSTPSVIGRSKKKSHWVEDQKNPAAPFRQARDTSTSFVIIHFSLVFSRFLFEGVVSSVFRCAQYFKNEKPFFLVVRTSPRLSQPSAAEGFTSRGLIS